MQHLTLASSICIVFRHQYLKQHKDEKDLGMESQSNIPDEGKEDTGSCKNFENQEHSDKEDNDNWSMKVKMINVDQGLSNPGEYTDHIQLNLL